MGVTKKGVIRLSCYLVGLFLATLGAVLATKAELGVTPVSAIPYTMTVVWGVEFGRATALFYLLQALLELPILRRRYRVRHLLQLPVGLLFGLLISACNGLMAGVSAPAGFLPRLALLLLSTGVMSAGVFAYVSAGYILLPPEGVLAAVSEVTGVRFSTLKLAGDVTMVLLSLTVCLATIGRPGSIGLGTVVAALLVGNEVKLLTRLLGKRLHALFTEEAMPRGGREEKER